MSAAVTLFTALLLFALDAPASGEEKPPAAQAGTLRLKLSPDILYNAARTDPYRVERADPSRQYAPRTLSRVKLFESGDMSAALGRDGRIHYRIPSPDFLGTKLGGEISTRSVKLTLKWPPAD